MNNSSLNSLLQAARKSSGREFVKDIIGEQKKPLFKKKPPPPKEKISSSEASDSDAPDAPAPQKITPKKVVARKQTETEESAGDSDAEQPKKVKKQRKTNDEASDGGDATQISPKKVFGNAVAKKPTKSKEDSNSEASDSDDDTGGQIKVKWALKKHVQEKTEKEQELREKIERRRTILPTTATKKKTVQFVEEAGTKSPKKQKRAEEKAQSSPKRRLSESHSEAFPDAEIQQQKKKKKKKHKEAASAPDEPINNGLGPKNPLATLLSNKQATLYLLKLPKDVDPKDLIGKTIPVNKSGKVRLRHKEKLQITPKENSSSNCQIFAPQIFRLGHIEGVLQAKRRVKVNHDLLQPLEKNFDVEQNVKERHPIFGSSFTDDLAMEEAVIERLENPQKSKKKKHKKEEADEPAEEVVEVVKKKKKKKHQEVEGAVVNDGWDEEPKKKKKKKNKEGHQEEVNLEFLQVNSEKEKKKKKKKETTEEEEPVKEKKKHKKHGEEKHKKQEEESDVDLDVFSILSAAKEKILGKS